MFSLQETLEAITSERVVSVTIPSMGLRFQQLVANRSFPILLSECITHTHKTSVSLQSES